MTSLNDPFGQRELRGFFCWDADFMDDLALYERWMYTAMHEDMLRKVIRTGRLAPRSTFNVLVRGATAQQPCSWLTLQDWHGYRRCNYFGPFVVRIPLRELQGRRFYVFERQFKRWQRFYFVQREERKPLFGKPAKRVDPRMFFCRGQNGVLAAGDYTQHEVLLTQPVSLGKAKVEATAHTWCAATSARCAGKLDMHGAIDQLESILGFDLMPPGARLFPKPFPLRHVIPPQHLPTQLRPV